MFMFSLWCLFQLSTAFVRQPLNLYIYFNIEFYIKLKNFLSDASGGVNEDSWQRLVVNGVLSDSSELFRLTYYGGVAHHLRKQVVYVIIMNTQQRFPT